MNHEVHSRSSLFLMELIIAIMFFSLASAVCIQLFAKAHIISDNSINKNNAIIQSQNIAEAFTGVKGNFDSLALMYPDSLLSGETSASEGEMFLFWDEDWNTIAVDDPDHIGEVAAFEAIVTVSENKASEIYSDCSTISETFEGTARKIEIAIADIRDDVDFYDEIPSDENDILYSLDTDYYEKVN
ncbi:MAG: hypothetical protein K6B41_05355 [Butyrivibrio sp.]|nr:hypothetical protein [Butyrivibrio sp.]